MSPQLEPKPRDPRPETSEPPNGYEPLAQLMPEEEQEHIEGLVLSQSRNLPGYRQECQELSHIEIPVDVVLPGRPEPVLSNGSVRIVPGSSETRGQDSAEVFCS
jgi:hypothetical protein